MSNTVFRLTKKQMETIGANSLCGLLINANIIPQHKKFTIEFETRSKNWCRKNNGADFIIIPEYVPMCLMEDIVYLTKNGFDIQFATVDMDD